MQLRRSATVLVALALLATVAACGSRLSDEERALAVQTGGQGGNSGLTAGSADTSGATTDVAAGDVATDAAGAPTDPGAAAPGAAPGAAAGATGEGDCQPGAATSPGVTPTEITVGNVSQLSGLVPDFAQTSVNGAKAYFNMVNNAGGVCGRKINLLVADDRFQSATNRAETEKLAPRVLAFVGNLSVVDDGGAPIIDQVGVADVSLATTGPRIAAKNNYSPNPIDPTAPGNGIDKIFNYFKQTEGVSKGAIFYQDVATGANQAERYKTDFQKAGIPVAATYPVAPTATNFRSQATDMKEKQIDIVITIAEINAIANLARAFGDVGYFPKVPFYGAQTYGQKFLQLAGNNAEGTQIGLIFAIPEEAASVPAIGAFNTWYRRTAPGLDADFFAILSWVAADMFVTALRQAGPDPTQAKIIEQLSTFTEYTAGGLVAPINPAQKKITQCFHVVAVKGGKWVKEHPAKGFQC